MMQKIILFLMALHSVFMTSAQVTTIALNDNWRFKPATPKLEKGLTEDWIKVKAPCLVHSALIENKIIPDLFYRDNETKYQWIEREDWVFENQFEVPAQWLMQDHVELNFKGLDTYADVFLNGELILKADNAFRSWQIDVKPHLREGVNFLRIFFYAAVKMDEENREIHGYALPGIPTNERVFSRKPQFHYGWDWGPRFVNVGIWRGVELNLWSTYRLKEMNIVQKKISQSEALIQSDFVVESDVEKEVKITFNIDNQSIEKQFNLRKGINQLFFANVKIPNPKLWWSRDLGEPHRYRITLSDGMQQLEQYVGLRTIELVREKDKKGETFYFRLNGVPVFAKGANYIPLNIFQDKVSASHYAEMIENAAQANMNMLRVWGGGIYENDEFYECCDKAGIMVWQDFMFACAMYPANKPFLQNIENEALVLRFGVEITKSAKHGTIGVGKSCFCCTQNAKQKFGMTTKKFLKNDFLILSKSMEMP
jgi:beta-mannosidase